MTSNEMWHIERMGCVLKNLNLPWFSVDAFDSNIRVFVLCPEGSLLYTELFDWDEDEV